MKPSRHAVAEKAPYTDDPLRASSHHKIRSIWNLRNRILVLDHSFSEGLRWPYIEWLQNSERVEIGQRPVQGVISGSIHI